MHFQFLEIGSGCLLGFRINELGREWERLVGGNVLTATLLKHIGVKTNKSEFILSSKKGI